MKDNNCSFLHTVFIALYGERNMVMVSNKLKMKAIYNSSKSATYSKMEIVQK